MRPKSARNPGGYESPRRPESRPSSARAPRGEASAFQAASTFHPGFTKAGHEFAVPYGFWDRPESRPSSARAPRGEASAFQAASTFHPGFTKAGRELVTLCLPPLRRQLGRGNKPDEHIGMGLGGSKLQDELDASKRDLTAARVRLQALESQHGVLQTEAQQTAERLRQREAELAAEGQECERLLRAKDDELGKAIKQRQLAEELLLPAAPTSGAVNANGAGDAFVAGLIAALLWPEPLALHDALRLALGSARQRIDVQVEPRGVAELLREIRAGSETVLASGSAPGPES